MTVVPGRWGRLEEPPAVRPVPGRPRRPERYQHEAVSNDAGQRSSPLVNVRCARCPDVLV